jgi:hypothetical protein
VRTLSFFTFSFQKGDTLSCTSKKNLFFFLFVKTTIMNKKKKLTWIEFHHNVVFKTTTTTNKHSLHTHNIKHLSHISKKRNFFDMHTSDVNNSWYHGYLFEYWNNFSSFNKKQTIKTTPFQKISKQEQCFQIFVIHFAQDNEEHSFNETVLFFWGSLATTTTSQNQWKFISRIHFQITFSPLSFLSLGDKLHFSKLNIPRWKTKVSCITQSSNIIIFF